MSDTTTLVIPPGIAGPAAANASRATMTRRRAGLTRVRQVPRAAPLAGRQVRHELPDEHRGGRREQHHRGPELEERFEGHSFDLQARNTTSQSASTPIRNGQPG